MMLLYPPQRGSGDPKDRDTYNFYQSVDGQHIILHSLNMKCLLHHHGSYDLLPHRCELGSFYASQFFSDKEKEDRLPSRSVNLICENPLSPDAFTPFMDEIRKREKQRKSRAWKEKKEKIKAEVAAAVELAPLVASFGQSSRNNFPPFSLDDFEALGNATPLPSSSPPSIVERSSFSNVTRLGFVAGHDSPGLKNELTSIQNNSIEVATSTAGERNHAGVPSFVNAISRTPPGAETIKGAGKRGKKPTRVLLSTTSVQRY